MQPLNDYFAINPAKVHHFLGNKPIYRKILQIYRNFKLFLLKMGGLLKIPALSQDFIIMGVKREKMMYYCIIFGSHREIRQAIGQKDQVRF